MGTVTIASTGSTYNIFGTFAEATTYLGASVDSGAIAWTALADNDARAKYMIAAARYLLTFKPIDPNGVAITTTTALVDVINGSYELVAALVANPALQSQAAAGSSNIARIGAGPASVEFFAPDKGTALPRAVMALLGPYLGGLVDSSAQGEATGNCAVPMFVDPRLEDSGEIALLDRELPL